jgi:RNA polymerase sigma factor (sigma-70 family)
MGVKLMETPVEEIAYKLASGNEIRLFVSLSVKELLEQSDRQIRSQRRQDRRYLDYVGFMDEVNETAMIDPQEDTANLFVRMEGYALLYAGIEKLSEVQRRRLCLHYVQNLTYQQIADLDNVSISAVGYSIKRATEQLFLMLTE